MRRGLRLRVMLVWAVMALAVGFGPVTAFGAATASASDTASNPSLAGALGLFDTPAAEGASAVGSGPLGLTAQYAGTFYINIIADTGGAVRVHTGADTYEVATAGNTVRLGPFSEETPLPPYLLTIDSVDDNYYFIGRSWGGASGLTYGGSQVAFSTNTAAGDLGSTVKITRDDSDGNSYVRYRFDERKSKVSFVANAPTYQEESVWLGTVERPYAISGMPSAMTLRATDAVRQGIPEPGPTCANPDYQFVGWNTRADGSGKTYASLDELYDLLQSDYLTLRQYKGTNGGTLDLTLYAQWRSLSSLTYTVTYDVQADETVSAPADQQVAYGSGEALADGPTYAGHRFDGWVTSDGTPVSTTAELDAYALAGATEIELRATWTDTYTVAFDAGGVVSDPEPVLVAKGEPADIAAPSAPDGWTFDGWLAPGIEGALTSTAQLDGVVAAGGTVTLTAAWHFAYQVSFYETKGGTRLFEAGVSSGQWSFPADPAREGFEFEGWYLGDAETGQKVDSAAALDKLAHPHDELTLVARWAQYYEVAFVVGEVGIAPARLAGVHMGDALALAEPTGYDAAAWRFDGWSADGVEGKVTSTSQLDGVADAGSTIVLTAAWTKLYRVAFNVDGVGEAPATMDVAAGTSVAVEAPAGDGAHRFDGWHAEGADGVITSTKQLDGSAAAGATLTLTASWTPTYTIEFSVGGIGSAPAAMSNVALDDDRVVDDPSAPAGQEFGGWWYGTGADAFRVTQTSQLRDVATAGATITLTARWNAYYTLVRDLGDGSAPSEQTVRMGGWTLESPQRDGYRFDGWTCGKGETRHAVSTAQEVDSLAKPGGTVTITATWTPEYTIVLNPKGGAVSTGQNTIVAYLGDGEGERLPDATRSGYRFDGWWYGSGDGASKIEATGRLDAVARQGDTIELTAAWVALYTVRFDAAGGSVEVPTMEVVAGEEQQLPTATRDHHRFDGWQVSTGASVATTRDLDALVGTLVEPGGEITVRASWTAAYTLTLDPANGNAATTRTVHVGEWALETPSYEDHRFLGWYDGAGEDATRFVTAAAVDAAAQPGGNVTLVARWATLYTVELDAAGGSVKPATLVVAVGESADLPVPTYEGHRFDGWVTSGGVKVASTADLDTLATTESPVALTATWTKTYAIVLSPLGGTLESTRIDAVVGEAQDLPIPTRKGYRFDGWTAVDGSIVTTTAELDDMAGAGGTTAVWAAWTKAYTLRLNAASGTVAPSSLEVVAGTPQTLPVPTRENHAFDGWSLADGTPVVTTATLDAVAQPGDVLIARAAWRATYTVALDAADGVVDPLSLVVTEGKHQALPTPTRHGYRFDGWVLEDGGKVANTADIERALEIEAGMTLGVRATWSKTYTLVLNGAGTSGGTVRLDVVAGESRSLPTPERRGYEFAGWAVRGTDVRAFTTADADAAAAAGAELSADPTWNGLSYRVVYDANGGSGSVASHDAVVGVSQPLASGEQLTLVGHRFSHWVVEVDDGVVVAASTADLDEFVEEADQQIVVSARWTEYTPTFTVRYQPNADGEAVENMPGPQTFALGSSTVLAEGVVPVRFGWSFGGWELADGNVTQGVQTAADVVKHIETVSDGSVVSVQASWRMSYVIELDAGDGTATQMDVVAGDSVALQAPARDGMRFNGWISPDGTTVTTSAELDGIAEPASVVVASASWSKLYTVLLDARGGTVARTNLSVVEGTSTTLTTPTRAGMSFAGWNMLADGSGATVASTADLDAIADAGTTVRLYAQWRATSTPSDGSNTDTEKPGSSDTPANPGESDPTSPSDDAGVMVPSNGAEDAAADSQTPVTAVDTNDASGTLPTLTSSSRTYAIDETVQRRVVPTAISEVVAANSPTAERTYPSASGKASRIAELAESGGEVMEATSAASEREAATEEITAIENRNTWAGAGAMTVAGAATIVGMTVLTGMAQGGAAAPVAEVAVRMADAGRSVVDALRSLIGRLLGR